MILAQAGFSDSECPPVQRLGLLQIAHEQIDVGEAIERECNIRMVLAKSSLAEIEAILLPYFRLGIVPELFVGNRQVAVSRKTMGMRSTEHLGRVNYRSLKVRE